MDKDNNLIFERYLINNKTFTYYHVLTEEQRLIEEGKIIDFIKRMGGKLKNAFNILNTKLIANPKLYKGMMVAGPIIASFAMKNFANLNVGSDVMQSFLETINGIDPSASDMEITDIISKWDNDHAEYVRNAVSADGTDMTQTVLNVGKEGDNSYAVSGSQLNSIKDAAPELGQELAPSYVQTSTQEIEQITTQLQNSDLKTVFKNFVVDIIKSTKTDGSGGSVLIEFNGVVPASSAEEATKIVTELLKNAIKTSGIDISTIKMSNPQLAQLNESVNQYLIELAMMDKIKNAASTVKNKFKNLITGAQNLANKIKSTFKKNPNQPETNFKFNLNVNVPVLEKQQQ